MIDLHTHILPGVDDGAATMEEAVALARTLAAEGVLLAAATPHVRSDYPTDPATMERLVGEVRAALEREGIDLRLRGGGEIALDRLDSLTAEELARFGLGGNREYLLLEFPYSGWPLALANIVSRLRADGITPVLAHPERNPDIQREPTRLESLVRAGALVQITAASLDGSMGRGPREAGLALIRLGLAHMVASDAHGRSLRRSGLAAAAAAIGDHAVADWLTFAVPHAIVVGGPLPERPAGRRRAWLRR